MSRVRVLYVLGSQRGGSTIVGRALGLAPGIVFAGEVRRFWERGAGPDRCCGCGLSMRACPVWSTVLAEVEAAGIDPIDVPRWQRDFVPVHHSWRTARRILRHGLPDTVAASGYARAMNATYRGLASAYGGAVIVDTSKLPADAALLTRLDVEPSFLHLVRDSRGVLASQLRRRQDESLPRRMIDTSYCTMAWTARHTEAARVHRAVPTAIRARYEDFARAPASTMKDVCSELDLPVPAVDADVLELPLVHTPGGALPATSVALEPDDRWEAELRRGQRWSVTALTAPLLKKYGYPLARGTAP